MTLHDVPFQDIAFIVAFPQSPVCQRRRRHKLGFGRGHCVAEVARLPMIRGILANSATVGIGFSMTRTNRITVVATAAILAIVSFSDVSGAEFMFRTRVNGQMLEGKPLAWSAEQMLLLGRDGRL